MDRPDQLADARRAQILDAATHVFAEKGFHRTTIRDIARRAGIADGTIYIYFKSKADLLLGILARLNESERRAVDLGHALDEGVDFRQFLTSYLRRRLAVINDNLRAFQAVLPDLLTNAELRERYLREVLEPSLRLAEPLFEALLQRGTIRPASAALVARAVPSMVLGLLMMRMLGDAAVEKAWAELPEFVVRTVLDGLLQEHNQ